MISADILGRAGELRALTELVERVLRQGGGIVILGEAGIGKSTLIGAAARLGRAAGLQVLQATEVEAEAQLPFAGLHQLLRPIMSGTEALPTPSAGRCCRRSAPAKARHRNCS